VVKWSRDAAVLGMAMMLSAGAMGNQKKIDTATKSFSVKLGATRMIYNPDSSGGTLSVINQQDYPILVQSRVYAADKQSNAPFVVTPPLFRLDGNQQSRVRVVRTGGAFAADRETLYWMCVTGVPPKPEDVWGQDQDGKSQAPKVATLEVQLRINNCIKLMVRPASLKGDPTDQATSVTWSREGGKLKAVNPTPFFMNLKEVSVGGRKVEGLDYLPPKGEKTFTLPVGASGKVQWKIITDYGGDSREYEAALQ